MNPLYFTLFTLAALLAYAAVPARFRAAWLLAASLLFFALLLDPLVWPALALMVLGTHLVSSRMESASTEAAKKRWLRLGIWGNLAILVFFKYLSFLAAALNQGLAILHVPPAFSAPGLPAFIGVSYLAFQAISYLLDIYYGLGSREPSLFYWALHLCLFPKAIQGPIERAGGLIPQLKQAPPLSYENLRAGMLQLSWGVFKKAVIADRLDLFVSPVFAKVHGQPGPALLLASYGFVIQLFCDFSGYTDMALGAARLFGFNLTQNFNAPFLATGLQDFWKRWHISLSSWILTYLFKPLQIRWRDLGTGASALALFVSFLAVGVWHGASWGFVVFGLLHGTYMALGLLYRPYKTRLHRFLGTENTVGLKIWQRLVTFNLVCLSFVFFKAASLSDALYVISHSIADWQGLPSLVAGPKGWLPGLAKDGRLAQTAILGACLCLLPLVYALKNRIRFFAKPAWFRWSLYLLLVFALIFLGRFFAEKQFIYSQF